MQEERIRGVDPSQKLKATFTSSFLILKTSVFAAPLQQNSFTRNIGLIPQVIIRRDRTVRAGLLLNYMQSVN